jgi:hypothetical protein
MLVYRGGLIDLNDLKLSRLLNAPPAPYTRDRGLISVIYAAFVAWRRRRTRPDNGD